jgi:hypothetical protein
MSGVTKNQLVEFMCRYRNGGPNAKMSDGDYLLTWALRKKIPSLANALLEKNADATIISPFYDDTPLILACGAPYKDIALKIIETLKKHPESRKHLNAQNKSEFTALMKLSYTDEAEDYNTPQEDRKPEDIVDDVKAIADALISADVDINICIDKKGYTAFFLACGVAGREEWKTDRSKLKKDIAEMLIQKYLNHGVSFDIRGSSASACINELANNQAMIKLIQDATARPEIDLVEKYAREITETPAPGL